MGWACARADAATACFCLGYKSPADSQVSDLLSSILIEFSCVFVNGVERKNGIYLVFGIRCLAVFNQACLLLLVGSIGVSWVAGHI